MWERGEDLREGASSPATSYAVFELSLSGPPSEASALPRPPITVEVLVRSAGKGETHLKGVTSVSGSHCVIQRAAGHAATPGSVSETKRT